MTVKELYEDIHGNYQNALKTMMNDNFIIRMLTKFIEGDPANNLFKAYENKDYPALFAASHSLKGVTGNLALDSLFNRIIPIVEKTRNSSSGDNIELEKEMDDFHSEYQLVTNKIKSFLNL